MGIQLERFLICLRFFMAGLKIGVGFGVMVLRGKKILLGKRHDDPEKADSVLHGEGMWTMPGGKLHFGETFEDATVREVKEETGLELDSAEMKLISITNDIVSDAHFVTLGFLYEETTSEPKVMEPDEIVEWDWFDLDDLPEHIYEPSRKVLENYKNGVVYGGS